MKSKFGFAVIVLVVGFFAIGCSSVPQVTFESIVPDSTNNIFTGTWMHPNREAANDTIIFSGNSFTKQWDGSNIAGRFVFDDRNITFVSDSGKTWKTPYKINSNNGSIEFSRGAAGYHWYGAFYKIDSNQNQKLDGSWRHPSLQAKEATYTFTGNQFTYTRNDGFTVTGDYAFIDKKLTIKVSGQIIREYICFFIENGSRIRLLTVSGDGNNYFQGVFEKQ